MATRDTIKSYFETGDKPTEAEFAEAWDSTKFKEEDTTAEDLLDDGATESLSGIETVTSGALTGLVQGVKALQEDVANLASASASIEESPTPQSVTTTESTLTFTESLPSTNTDIIEVNTALNYITIKRAGRYQFITSLEVENTSQNQDRVLTIRTRDYNDDEIFSERTVDCPSNFTRTDFRYVPIDIEEGDLPLELYVTLQGTGDLELNKLETTLSAGASVVVSGGLSYIFAASNTEIRAVTDYADNVGVINTSTKKGYKFVASEISADDDDIYLTPDNIIEPDPGRWVRQVELVGAEDINENFFCNAILPDFGVITRQTDFKIDTLNTSGGTWTITDSSDVAYVLGSTVTGGDYLKITCDTVGETAQAIGEIL